MDEGRERVVEGQKVGKRQICSRRGGHEAKMNRRSQTVSITASIFSLDFGTLDRGSNGPTGEIRLHGA